MTPTCNTCGAKFPGKVVCRTCGADPNGKPEIEARIKLVKAAVKGTRDIGPALGKLTDTVVGTSKQMTDLAKEFAKIPVEDLRKYERRLIRAKARSMRTTQVRAKHGAHRG